MNIRKLSKLEAVTCICAAVTAIINIISSIFLPDDVVTQISFSGYKNTTSSLLYFLGITVFVIISSAMTILLENKRKWMLISIILTLLNIAVVIYNFSIL